jgi:hypothetical protein
MLIPLPLNLSRALRQKRILPFFPVTTWEIGQALSEAVQETSCAAVFVLQPTTSGALPFDHLYRFLYQLVEKGKAPVSLVVRARVTGDIPNSLDPQVALSLPAELLAGQSANLIARYDRYPDPVAVQELVRRHQASAMELYCSPNEQDGTAIHTNLTALSALTKQARIPLIMAPAIPSPRLAQSWLAAGIAGAYLEGEPESAFTATLRTILRDRHQQNASVIQQKAAIAVRQWAVRQLRHPLQLT